MLLLGIFVFGASILSSLLTFAPLSDGGGARVDVKNYYLREDKQKDYIEQSIVTICETIKVLRKLNGCYTGTVSELLGFLQQGTSYRGTLSDLSLYPRTSGFSCANADNYGRYLLFSSLTPAEVAGYGYDIDVGRIGQDPCGIGDFVYRR